MYTVREFRGKLRECLDRVDTGRDVYIRRNGKMYTVTGVHDKEYKRLPVVDDAKELEKKLKVEHYEKKGLVPKYGCGCKKEEGRVLCKAHGRV